MSGENKLSWTVKDLIPNGEYFFRVKAVNKIGGGEYIELKNPVIASSAISSPLLTSRLVFIMTFGASVMIKSNNCFQF